MGVGKTHPTEPVAVVVLGAEPLDGSIGYPVGVIPLAGHVVELDLRCSRVTPARSVDVEITIDHAVKTGQRFRVLVAHPLRVMKWPDHAVGCELQIVKPAVHPPAPVEPRLLY